MFRALQLGGWRQFREVELSFHDHLTVLTGANGAGKTTILNMLNRHFGWNLAFISTPRRRKELVDYFSDYWLGDLTDDQAVPQGHRRIGEIGYRDGQSAAISVPEDVSHEYQVSLRGQQTVAGLFVASHRPVFFYQRVAAIPTEPSAREQLLNAYLSEIRTRYSAGGRVQSPSHRLKEALISLAVFGYGNEVVAPNAEYRRTFEGYQEVLRIVLPPVLGFQQLRIEMPEVVLDTDGGPFSLDAVSGGVSAILDMAWQIYMYSTAHDEFCVVIDEPENHLHPELQQTLLPALLEAFPQAQFVIATHNPFMVSSVPDSNVYVLRFEEDNRVTSELLDTVNKAGTSNEILRDVLGLAFTMPLWAERHLEEIVIRYSAMDLTDDVLAQLRQELAILGMSHLLPQTIGRIVDVAE